MQLPAVSALSLAILASCASSKTTAEVGIGAGSYGVSFDGGDSGSTNAALFELALESVSASHFGGGARLRGTASGDDLFDGVEQYRLVMACFTSTRPMIQVKGPGAYRSDSGSQATCLALKVRSRVNLSRLPLLVLALSSRRSSR